LGRARPPEPAQNIGPFSVGRFGADYLGRHARGVELRGYVGRGLDIRGERNPELARRDPQIVLDHVTHDARLAHRGL
jgi:hypothetical protein